MLHPPAVPELEVDIRRGRGAAYTVDLRLFGPEGMADAELAVAEPIRLRHAELTASAHLPAQYAEQLNSSFFTPSIRAGWLRAVAYAEALARPLRVRLRLDPRATALHALRWELLRNPADGQSLVRSGQIFFSRFLASGDLQPAPPLPRQTLRALVAIAAPSDATTFGLAAVDGPGECERLSRALAGIEHEILAPDRPEGRATRSTLIHALQTGGRSARPFDLLVLVCHGRLSDGASFLALEQPDGRLAWTAGQELVATLAALPRRPRFALLLSCASAGHLHADGALSALGPQLATAGVGAIVAMQGDVPIALATQLSATLFRELQSHGLIDQALAAARLALPEHSAWWMPVLYMRLRDGRLWHELPPAAAAPAPQRLSSPLGSLIGRGVELVELGRQLRSASTRLLTLTGPGGVGKSRLALQLAAELQDAFAHGAVVAQLAAVREQDRVPVALLRALGLDLDAERPPLSQLLAVLRERELLLCLDTVEQLAGLGALVADLLAHCPRLKILATGRRRLDCPGEQEFPIRPLPLPNLRRLPAPDELARFPSVALLLARTQEARPDFALTHANAAAIAGICVALDGLPLALELAAARVRVLTPQAMLPRLRRKLDLLGADSARRPEHQRTLRATLDWSYALLDVGARAPAAALGLFAAPFSIEAAEAVVGPAQAPHILDTLAELVESSLLELRENADGEPRYAMLQVVREYMLERLDALDATQAVAARRRHADHYLELAGAADAALRGPERQRWLAALEQTLPDLYDAMEWALGQGDSDLALALATRLWQFWLARGAVREGRHWLDRCLARAESLPVARWLEALDGMATMALAEGAFVEAALRMGELIATLRDYQAEEYLPPALAKLGAIAAQRGDFAGAEQAYAEALALAEHHGDEAQRAGLLINAGTLALDQGDLPLARERLAAGLARLRQRAERDPLGEALALLNLGRAAFHQHDLPQARRELEQAQALLLELHDEQYRPFAQLYLSDLAQLTGADPLPLLRQAATLLRDQELPQALCELLEAVAAATLNTDRAAQGLQLAACAQQLRDTQGKARPTLDQRRFALYQSDARARLGEQAYAAAWGAGSALAGPQALELALSLTRAGQPS